jgi:hypothetical protein
MNDMKRGKSSKKKAPSREKYEKENPTVSARLPKEKRDKLLAVLRSIGLSLANLLVSFADEYEVKVKPINEARQAGYEEAKNRYMVTYPCSVCGELIPLTSPKAKQAASKYMTDHGWGHAECHKQRR